MSGKNAADKRREAEETEKLARIKANLRKLVAEHKIKKDLEYAAIVEKWKNGELRVDNPAAQD
jgi:hypothetical protein